MSQNKSIFIYGFAIFAMFFGSGNLVFPLQIGLANGDHWLIGFMGLLITGILLPFLGLFVIKLQKGNYHAFFAGAGKTAGIVLPLIMLSLLGSFGIVPRCVTVAYGSLSLGSVMPLFLFSFLFSAVMYIMCLNDKMMIQILGKWLCPIKLVALFIIITVSIAKAPETVVFTPAKEAFLNGFRTGYQTMDLFAAFFFSALTFSQIQNLFPANTPNRDVIRFAIKPSIIAALLLAIVYLGFVYLGAHYSTLIQNVPPESILPTIVQYTMGSQATLWIGIAILLSCLCTAVALNNLYARYLCKLFKLKEDKFYLVLMVTTGISFVISLLDFRGIALFLQPILEITYPGVIALTITSILFRHYQKVKTGLFYAITASMLIQHSIVLS